MKKTKQKNKRVITYFLAMFIIMSTFLHPVHANTSFVDTIPTWAKNAVDYLVEKGAIQGYPDGTFQPSNAITRAEAAAILAESLGLEIDENAKASFGDTQNHWASATLKALEAQKPGVINGYVDGSFKPNNNITRQEMAKMIVEAYDFELNEERQTSFSDNTGWGAKFVNILSSLRVVEGVAPGKFDPNANVTRAQTAVFVHRATVVFPITINPEFSDVKTVEQDGIKFEIMLSQTDENLYAKIKATNISEDTIPYVGYNGCDRGLSANLFAESDDEEVQVGSKWRNLLMSCTQAVVQRFLEPGAMIEVLEVLSPPTEGFKENHYIKVKFQKGLLDDTSPSIPLEIEIPIELE